MHCIEYKRVALYHKYLSQLKVGYSYFRLEFKIYRDTCLKCIDFTLITSKLFSIHLFSSL